MITEADKMPVSQHDNKAHLNNHNKGINDIARLAESFVTGLNEIIQSKDKDRLDKIEAQLQQIQEMQLKLYSMFEKLIEKQEPQAPDFLSVEETLALTDYKSSKSLVQFVETGVLVRKNGNRGGFYRLTVENFKKRILIYEQEGKKGLDKHNKEIGL